MANAVVYYVTIVRDGTKVGFLSGPYPTHDEARARVDDVARLARSLDPWADFDAFGVSSLSGPSFPFGRLDPHVRCAL